MNNFSFSYNPYPILSIIVPIYNSQEFLLDALKCLKKQNLPDIEFILINDCATDKSEEIILNFINQDKRFRYIKKNKNTGYGDSCNLGICKSKGKYIAVFEPDDLIPEDFYEILIKSALIHGNADIIKYNGIYEVSGNIKNRLFTMNNTPKGLFVGKNYPRFWRTHPSTVNAIYKKEFITKNDLKYVSGQGASYQDAQFFTSLYYSNPNIVIIDECKYLYRRHENQSTVQIPIEKIDIVINNWAEFFTHNTLKIKPDNIWFATIQMYRQFASLNKHFDKGENKLNFSLASHIIKTKMPKIKDLRWFGLNWLKIIYFYRFLIKGYILILTSKIKKSI